MAARVRIGELLVDAGFLTVRDLDAALQTQAEHANAGRSRKLGQILLAAGRITATQLTQTLGMQLSVPWASLTHVEFEPALLARVPAAIAQKYKLIPIFVRFVRGKGETIYVAMDDPTNDAALAEVSALAKLPVRAMIASPTDVQRAIRLHYFGEAPDDDGPVLEVTELEIPLPPRASRPDETAPTPAPSKPSVSVPPPPQSTITLLDGTSLAVPKRNLPAAGAPPPPPPPPPPSSRMKAASAPPPPLPLQVPSQAPPASSSVPPPDQVAIAVATSTLVKMVGRMEAGSDAERAVASALAILVRKGVLTEAEIETELARR